MKQSLPLEARSGCIPNVKKLLAGCRGAQTRVRRTASALGDSGSADRSVEASGLRAQCEPRGEVKEDRERP